LTKVQKLQQNVTGNVRATTSDETLSTCSSEVVMLLKYVHQRRCNKLKVLQLNNYIHYSQYKRHKQPYIYKY